MGSIDMPDSSRTKQHGRMHGENAAVAMHQRHFGICNLTIAGCTANLFHALKYMEKAAW